MANAIIGGLLQKGVAAGQISVVEIDADARARLSERLHVVTTSDVAAGRSRRCRRCAGGQTAATAGSGKPASAATRQATGRQYCGRNPLSGSGALARRLCANRPRHAQYPRIGVGRRFGAIRYAGCGRARPTNCNFDSAERRHHSLGRARGIDGCGDRRVRQRPGLRVLRHGGDDAGWRGARPFRGRSAPAHARDIRRGGRAGTAK